MSNLSANNLRYPQKTPLKPGRSPLDWSRLTSSITSLRGPPPESPQAQMGRITKKELVKHKQPEDAWTILGGRVYNITPYMEYHPGGQVHLMRAAGRDGSALFNKYHAWVNYEVMLEKCCVGIYVGDTEEF